MQLLARPPPPPYHNFTPKQHPLFLPHYSSSSSSPSHHHHHLRRRRDFAASTLLLLLIAPADALSADTTTNCHPPTPTTSKAFLDISIDGDPIGRITIGLYGDAAPAGSARFRSLVSGAAGVSYRRKDFIRITPNYVQHGGVRSYGIDAELAQKRQGSNFGAESLLSEWEKAAAASEAEECKTKTRNVAGSVSIIVRNPSKPPPKMKVVARQGKLEIDQEEVGVDPNGTEFVIAIKDSPELDPSALVVGKVLQGMDIVERIGQVKTVQENSSSPYFRVAKLIGDKRAVVAERGFNRPYSKVVVTNCGLIE
ncbi:peptidyl-prolyl cis-trans isomerase CYP26-2, chloroplastic [Andrographis paniculata]|uniref:peptidyl-prolyl cis-trans isomerase CYP26-2, chloroplastic n=1 Tax=Andrographis paniculata TaxID=175694 RepID=UPI0021E861D6|nr:peptidyl-prolyl cis-trans isomerase CYP26-2, chloroplastic [Andrographis paniculata]